MKHHYPSSIINASFSLLFFVFAITAYAKTPLPPVPQASSVTDVQEGVPGRVTVNSLEVSARVAAIDTKNRKITLLLPNGEKEKVMVPPEAVNFDQIKEGDLVKATVTESLVIYLDEENKSVPDEFAAGIALAPEGAKPGAVVAGTVKVTATVTAIDESERTATLSFNDGTVETFPVRDDIDLSKRKVGEQVVFIMTEMVALSLEKP
jgi:hypothetical protein